MCCKAERELYPSPSQLGPATLNYCAFCAQYGAEPLELLKDILGEPNPASDISIPFYDPDTDWYRDYMTGTHLEPARTNDGKNFSSLGELCQYADKLQAKYEASQKKRNGPDHMAHFQGTPQLS